MQLSLTDRQFSPQPHIHSAKLSSHEKAHSWHALGVGFLVTGRINQTSPKQAPSDGYQAACFLRGPRRFFSGGAATASSSGSLTTSSGTALDTGDTVLRRC